MDADSAVKNVLKEYARRCNDGDLDRWLGLWAATGVQMPPDAPARVGTDEIRAGMKPVFDTMDLHIVIHHIDEALIDGDRGLTRCTYSLSATPKGGGDAVQVMPDGKALTLYEKHDGGEWKITHDCCTPT